MKTGKLIVICGLPGTGKTTLAEALSKELQIVCLHKDSVKESLYESLNLSTLEESKGIGLPAIKVILAIAEEAVKNGIDIILEAPFNFPEEGVLFRQWQKVYDIEIFTVVLEVDQAEREKRFLERERHKSHHDGERVRLYREEDCDYEHMPEKKIFLKTDKTVSELVADVRNALSE